ncbi:MAG TPA: SDR family oxidoreductase [Tepidisphaeraceae bacterium]|jgi:NAD(P)-dependent dehydrogenase (short-subunit alcohol dehydrogenase family)
MPAALDKFRMDGRIALLTGAARGIGLAMAKALASVGCAVAIQDIEEAIAREEAEKIRAAGGRAIAFGGDIGDLSLIPQLVRQTVHQLGGLHVLINNAAIQNPMHWLDMSTELMERELRTDLLAPIVLCQQVVPILKAQRWGRIINLGSVQQRGGNPNMLSYSLSKAALEKFTTALARDLAKDQITVNNIAPGWFNTLRNKHDLRTPQIVAERGKNVPVGRVGEPEDCDGVTLLLCSDAGWYITGQTIYVSGGF